MQRADDQVTREGGFDGDGGSLTVADLPDHNDLRVLTQHAAQTSRKIELGPWPRLRLADAFNNLFNGILNGHYMPSAPTRLHQVSQASVDRRGLAASTGA